MKIMNCLYEYKFVFEDGNLLLGTRNAEIVFNKIELLPKLIHGGPGFKPEDEKIVDGFFETDKLSSYMDSSQFSDIVDSILGIIEPSGSIVKNCMRLGGCEYLEEKLKNKNEVEMNRDYFGSIVDPTWDSKNIFEWVQMSCYESNFRDELKKLNDDGFIIVSSTDFSSEKSSRELNVFNFRKLRSENI